MNNHPPSDISGGASATSALVSLVSLILAFLNSHHIWLQNITLLVSLGAGLFAISAGLIKLCKWIKSLIIK